MSLLFTYNVLWGKIMSFNSALFLSDVILFSLSYSDSCFYLPLLPSSVPCFYLCNRPLKYHPKTQHLTRKTRKIKICSYYVHRDRKPRKHNGCQHYFNCQHARKGKEQMINRCKLCPSQGKNRQERQSKQERFSNYWVPVPHCAAQLFLGPQSHNPLPANKAFSNSFPESITSAINHKLSSK